MPSLRFVYPRVHQL